MTNPSEAPPSDLALQPASVVIDEGELFDLQPVDPTKASAPVSSGVSLSWQSSDPSIATVQNGRVQAHRTGEVTISATATGGLSAASQVTVERLPFQAELMGLTDLRGSVGELLNRELAVRVVNRRGHPVPEADVRFEAVQGGGKLSPIVARTDADGVARSQWTLGPTAGLQRVEVRSTVRDRVLGVLSAQAEAGDPARVVVVPEQLTLRTGVPFKFEAQLQDAYGNRISAVPMRWASSDDAVASVATDGTVVGHAAGSVTIEAELPEDLAAAGVGLTEGIAASGPGQRRGQTHVDVVDEDGNSTVSVTKSGGDGQTGVVGEPLAQELEVWVTDSNGTPIRQTDVSWRVTSGGGSVSDAVTRTNGQGRASVALTLGTRVGSNAVEATVSDLGSATFSASAVAGPIDEVRVSPSSAKVEVGQSTGYGASAYDQYGNLVTDHGSPEWAVASAAVASISDEGSATGQSEGSTEVQASVEGMTMEASLTVEGGGTIIDDSEPTTISSVGASADEVLLEALEESVTLQATAYDEDGSAVSGVTFEWESTDAGIATVTSSGTVTAKAVGIALVIVSAGCCEAADTVMVTVDQTVAAVQVDPSSVTVGEGETRQLAAKVLDSKGFPIEGASVAWKSSDPSVATVSDSGDLTALSEGTASVTAAAEGQEGTASVSVGEDSGPILSGDRPNEPDWGSSGMVWLEHDMKSLPNGAASHAGYFSTDYGSNYTVATSSDFPGGGRDVVRIRYPKGHEDGKSPGRFFGHNRSGGPSVQPQLEEFYIHLWVQLEGEDWEAPPNELKLWYKANGSFDGNRGGGWRNRHWEGGQGAFSKPTRIHYTWREHHWEEQERDGTGFQTESADYDFVVGSWHRLEVYIKNSSPGKADGVLRVWFDGELKVDRSIQNQYSGSHDWTQGFTEFHWAPVYGGRCSSGCPKERDDYMRISDLYISGKPKQ